MSFSILIKAIQERPELWLSTHDNYKDKTVTNATWLELSEKFGIETKILKTRWNMLKELYKKELRKMTSTDEEEWRHRWMYFEEMRFLKDEMLNLKPSRRKYGLKELQLKKAVIAEKEKQEIMKNAPIEQVVHNDNVVDDLMNDDCIIHEFQIFTNFSPFLINMMFDSSLENEIDTLEATYLNTFLEEMLAIENKKLQLMKTSEESMQTKKGTTEDPELMYFRSVLPFVKKMTNHQKLQFQIKINEILQEIMSQSQ